MKPDKIITIRASSPPLPAVSFIIAPKHRPPPKALLDISIIPYGKERKTNRSQQTFRYSHAPSAALDPIPEPPSRSQPAPLQCGVLPVCLL